MRIVAAVAAIAVAVVLGGILLVTTPWAPPSAETACDPPGDAACVRVLFLGNSYTFVNDLPRTFRALARSSGRDVATTMVAEGGETLGQHATSDASLGAIRRGGWSYVVLQEQSEIPSMPGSRAGAMEPAARTLVDEVKRTGARPVLLETWAHRDGWPDNGLDYARMQAAIDDAYRSIGQELISAVAPAGEAWQSVRSTAPSIDLWQDDGSHPTLAGTYLTACVLYATVFRASSVELSETLGLPADTDAALQRAASTAAGIPAP
jgi:hypothetical protein